MTQPTHDEVMAWIDKEVKFIDEIHPNGGNSKNVTSFWTNYRASLLANRAVLERHKERNYYGSGRCGVCMDNEEHGYELTRTNFPCPTYTDIYDPIRSVM